MLGPFSSESKFRLVKADCAWSSRLIPTQSLIISHKKHNVFLVKSEKRAVLRACPAWPTDLVLGPGGLLITIFVLASTPQHPGE